MSKATFFAFIAGAAVGSVATWQLVKKKYEQKAREEIDSVVEYYSKDSDISEPKYDHSGEIVGKVESVEQSDDGIKAKVTNVKPGIVDYVKKLQEEGYVDYSSMSKPTQEKKTIGVDGAKPYVISPDQFGEIEDYQQVSLVYFEDQVLADDNNEIVDDIEGTVGFASLTRIGEWEEDAIHVRNDRLRCDFEILKDLRLYANVIADKSK